ncbi:MAG: hypothetical protein KDD72_15910 [Anaerolineales bacterium]|nr:hypothetical protein [Anaerolineales bacterium]
MRKSTLFISAMLTVFLMATLFGVVSAYQQVIKDNDQTSAQVASQPVTGDFMPVLVAPEPADPMVVTPEEATTIAIDFLGDSGVYSVEVVDYEGAPTYLVTFSSGDLVYVNSIGAVIANTKLEPVVVIASSGGGNSNQNNSGGNSGGERHDDDDHDDHDDDDHDDHDDHDD